ncbi:MAG: phosphoribosylformylglycinamidine synthase subunit PurQ [Archaeoglobaceae archaeon]|nr:phosphoribosylformylglycinamidine synthase subunit PurQ [Archaeoglobaceae archaeon]MDW7989651.1 phosphoribosylformylglycinamidine synthase subunit PurQ [Archaeoglobaceae archaeon]
MDREEIRVAVLRIEGTNCEEETATSFRNLGVEAEIVHLKQFYSDMIRFEDQRSIFDYHCIVFPGGFSAGDYVRAGAIFSARVKSVLRKDLEEFIKYNYPILGICNGFQILAELGALPGFDEDRPISDRPEMALAINDSGRFECRQTLLRVESRKCVFTKEIEKDKLQIPVAHAEGKVVFPRGREEEYLEKLKENEQLVFRYVDDKGNYSGYPWNPNGSFYNIAGICNVTHTVLGLMPHPERVTFDYRKNSFGDGYYIFKSVISYLEKI